MAKFGISLEQAQVASIITDILFKAVALGVMLVLLVAGFILFGYTVVYRSEALVAAVAAGLETVIGVISREVYKGLFNKDGSPRRSSDA